MVRTRQVPVAEGLFTWPSEDSRLIGTQCADCLVVTFPTQSSCPRCNSERMEETLLHKRGTLWTWTTQGFLPKAPPYAGTDTPQAFKPYAVGYVEFADQVRVEGRLTECDPERLRIGMKMELAIVPFRKDDDVELMTFAFKPVESKEEAR